MRHLILTALLACGMASNAVSQHYYYIPNGMVSPVLKKQHSWGVSALMGRGGDFEGWEAQAYYALSNRMVITGSYLDSGKKAVLNNLQDGTKYRFGEFGLGLYEALQRGSASLVAGYGRGFLYNYYLGDEAAEFNVSRWFLKSNLTYQENYFQGGFDMRISYLRYENGKVPINLSASDTYTISLLEEAGAFLIPEFGVYAGLRFKPVFIGLSVTGIYRRTYNLGFARVNSSIIATVEF